MASQKTKTLKIILDHCTRPVVLFSHQINNLLWVGLCMCTKLVFWLPSWISYQTADFVPSGKLTPAQSSLRVGGRCYKPMTMIRMSVAAVTVSLAAKISLCTVIVYNHRLGWHYNGSIKLAPGVEGEFPAVSSGGWNRKLLKCDWTSLCGILYIVDNLPAFPLDFEDWNNWDWLASHRHLMCSIPPETESCCMPLDRLHRSYILFCLVFCFI